MSELIHEDDRDRFSDIKNGHLVFKLRSKEGSWVWLEAKFRAIKKSGKDLLTGYVRDISEIKGLELGYLHRTSHIMTLMNAIPGFVSWLSSDLTYIGVNEALASASGVTQEAFLGKKFGFLSQYADEATESKTFQWLKNFSEDEEEMTAQTETQLRGPYGTRYFLLSAAKYGEQKNIVLIGIDHSKIKDLEKEVETEKARNVHQARMAALGEMASGIAHEINNPLQIIIGVGGEIIKRVPDIENHKEHLKKSGEMLERAGERIAKIVQGLKTFSRDGSNDQVERVQLSTIINDTVDFAQANFKKRNAKLEVEPFDKMIEAECRSVQISQVIVNLCSNALDAIEPLAEKWVKVSVKDLGNEVEVSVTDSGNGIPPEIVAKMMNPFFTTKGVGKGTGLGLSISTGILKSHHGTLGYDENSKNTRFYIRWPKRQVKQKLEH